MINDKIILLRPTYGSKFQITPPISLGCLASNLRKNCFNNLVFIDGTLNQYTPEQAAQIIIHENPKIIGVQIYTGAQSWTREMIRILRSKNSEIIIVAGGPHISALKEIALEHISADYGIVGEGEESFALLCNKLITNHNRIEFSEIPGLIYKKDKKYFQSKIPFARLSDLDSFPGPDYGLLKIENYFEYMEGATVPLKGKRPVPIITSRGCPYNCTFCSSSLIFSKRIRYRAVEKVVEELEFLKKNYNIDEFFVTDDNLTLDMERAEKFFDLLIEKNLNLFWRAPNGLRADRLSEPLIAKMKKSGCYFVGIGVETGSPEMMKAIKKSLDLNIIQNVTALLKKHKILSSGFFMVGLPLEKEEDAQKTVDFIKKSNFDRIQVATYSPYPGSEDFDNLFDKRNEKEYKKLIHNYLYKGEIPKITKYLSYSQVHDYQKKMINAFYFRPRTLFSLLRNLKFSQLKAILSHPLIRRWFDNKHDRYLEDIKGWDIKNEK